MRPAPLVLCAAVLGVLSSSLAFASVSFTQKTSGGAASLTHADLNNDGREDFVYPAPNGTAFRVQLSDGDGTYAAPVSYALPGNATVELITIADFNGDGKADLFVLGTPGGTQN